MPPRKKKTRNTRSNKRLLLAPAAVAEVPWQIPTRWLNTVIGIFLLPIALLLTQTFFTVFSRAALDHAFWATEEFWFFSLGSILWLIWFLGSIWSLGEPFPLRPYIFGHELTHAIWVWLWGGEVKEFEVHDEGGYIVTDTHNFWIALAPYFYPIFSIALILFYGGVSLFYDLSRTDNTILWMTPLQILFLCLGITWAFHMSFTVWMIPKGQSDLTQHGTFFSLVIIYLINLLLLSLLLVIAAPEISLRTFGGEFLVHAEDVSSWIWSLATVRP